MLIIDDEIVAATQISEEELKREIALFLYSKGMLSQGQARKITDLDFIEFEKLLVEHNIPNPYSVQELETDLATLQALRTT
ncbi:MAG: UPF0175 family protein [Ignavibacteriae bacterium]|nr:UPF0175 family protein [Ignavibacteriota bacterium]